MMFVFDAETLGKKSDAVILSIGVVAFDLNQKSSYQDLLANSFFVKLDAIDQARRLKRTMTPSTAEWWEKQCDIVKAKSFYVDTKNDVKIEDGYEMLREWVSKFPGHDKAIVWARGDLDQLLMDDFEESVGIKPVFEYRRWRDVRTAVDLMYGTTNGYTKVDYPGFDPHSMVYKHDPVHDSAYDAMMLMYGTSENG